jgi:hypothetical protein
MSADDGDRALRWMLPRSRPRGQSGLVAPLGEGACDAQRRRVSIKGSDHEAVQDNAMR